ncbi:MAG TPA: hypothetical protein VFE50_20960, partial [Cyclobacteriaceae bacterium]|nr:hypothetical protein [Cyclobacteriaceae bacterium]
LYTTPWTLAAIIPGLGTVTQYYDQGWDWIVRAANAAVFQLKDELVPMAGSGDTSFGWAQLCFTLSVAIVGCAVWSALDRQRPNYDRLDYWFRLSLRYYISFYCFTYGIIKLFALQMPFPNISQLATPLGDFLPMRLSWMFVGYSTPYQIFSGVMETLAGVCLLNRKTVALGLIMAMGVFIHVVALNLAYDIPVKLFSIHLLLCCVFLALYELRRFLNFFILNRVSEPDTSFNLEINKKWMRYTRIAAKVTFIIFAVFVPLYESYDRYSSILAESDIKPIRSGLYDVDLYVLNNRDTVPSLVTDTLRWHDVVFDKNGGGSIKTSDPMFRQRYRRGYFTYKPDTLHEILELRMFPTDSVPLMTMKYKLPDENTIHLWTDYKGDSLYLRLRRSKRHFQLAERQFHWLSEANR